MSLRIKRARKYRNVPTTVDGMRFDSRLEARRWAELRLLEAAGKITDLARQVPFVLAPSVRLDGEAKAKPALKLVADFTYRENGVAVVEDAKSPSTEKTAVWRIKKHLLKAVHGLDVRVVR